MKRTLFALCVALCCVCMLPTAGSLAAATVTPPSALVAAVAPLWEKIDGSTATIPLTTAMYNLFNKTGTPPVHNTTADAYRSLTGDYAELIFVTYPSENELEIVREAGVALEIIPIVKDALVFLINAENPVKGLSVKQLQGIYAGKTTNWQALEGLNEAIVPYQRSKNSGSQTLLQRLVMGDVLPMDPPNEWVAAEMGGLVEFISNYDNSRAAIGYSMFYYVNNMYGNSRFKLLDIEDVSPNRDTIAAGDYPFGTYYYAVFRKATPVNSPIRQLVDWLCTDDGQTLAVQAGYIPLRPLQGVIADDIDPVYQGEMYQSSGTGGTTPKSDDAYKELTQKGVRKPLSDVFFDGFNYIVYINDTILDFMNSPESAHYASYNSSMGDPSLNEFTKRAFPGIPNDYPHYAIMEWDTHTLRIEMPDVNPYFERNVTFYIPLYKDISPYGEGEPPKVTVRYDFDRQMAPGIDLYTLEVNMKTTPEIAKRINEQLKAWTDGFQNNATSMAMLDNYAKWCLDQWGDFYTAESPFVYKLQPDYGILEHYLSVSYSIDFDYESSFGSPMVYDVCIDLDTGERVDLIDLLPRTYPFEKATVVETVTRFVNGEWPNTRSIANYDPPPNTYIVKAWYSYGSLNMVLKEASGRLVSVWIRGEDVEGFIPQAL